MHYVLQTAAENLASAQNRQSLYANKHKKAMTFKVGDMVLINTAAMGKCLGLDAFDDKYAGPYRVIRVFPPNAYELELPPNVKLHNIFNVSKLAPYKCRTPNEISDLDEEEPE